MSDSRVERMFGPRENWGKGDEMAAVRERPRKGRKGNPSVGKADSSPERGAKIAPSVSEADSSPMLAHRGAKGNGTGAVPYGKTGEKEADFHRGGAPWGGLAGFVSIRCECGRVVNTCLRQRTPVFRCKDCGGETSLERVANIHMKCARCGFTGKYRTNRTEEKIQMECLNCSDIVYLTKVRRGNYVVEGEECDA